MDINDDDDDGDICDDDDDDDDGRSIKKRTRSDTADEKQSPDAVGRGQCQIKMMNDGLKLRSKICESKSDDSVRDGRQLR